MTTTNKLDPALFRAYMTARRDCPQFATVYALRTARATLTQADRPCPSLSFRTTHRGEAADYPIDAALRADIAARGFDPEHVTIRVVVEDDLDIESIEEIASNMGVTLHECKNRPDHTAARFTWDRSRYFVTVNATDAIHPDTLRGMSRGVRVQAIHDARKRYTTTVADYLESLTSGAIRRCVVSVAVYWRSEEVGSDAVRGVELSRESDVLDAVRDCDMIANAIDAATSWADSAAALLPRRSFASQDGAR